MAKNKIVFWALFTSAAILLFTTGLWISGSKSHAAFNPANCRAIYLVAGPGAQTCNGTDRKVSEVVSQVEGGYMVALCLGQ